VDEAVGEPLRLLLDDDYQDTISFHRWFAMRGTSVARAAVAFTTSPEWLSDPGKLALVASGNDAAIASAITDGKSNRKPGSQEERLLDLCAGVGTVGAMAARLGFDALSLELSIVPHLIDRVLHDFAVSLVKGSSSAASAGAEHARSWRGFATEVADFECRLERREGALEGFVRRGRRYQTLGANCSVPFLREPGSRSLQLPAISRYRSECSAGTRT
jgi:hypothetical protein